MVNAVDVVDTVLLICRVAGRYFRNWNIDGNVANVGKSVGLRPKSDPYFSVAAHEQLCITICDAIGTTNFTDLASTFVCYFHEVGSISCVKGFG